MTYKERRYFREGIHLPIHCMRMRKSKDKQADTNGRHFHRNIELLYGLSGKAIAYLGDEAYSLLEGELVMIAGEIPHDAYSAEGKAEYLVVQFSPTTLFAEEQTLAEHICLHSFLENLSHGKIHFSKEELAHTQIGDIFRRMISEWELRPFGYELNLRADLMQILVCVLRVLKTQGADFGKAQIKEEQKWLITRALSHVKEHYFETSERRCADALGVSACYLSRIFKQGMKISFSEHLMGVKLMAAERLLATTKASVTEISLGVGLTTASHFITNFRKRYHTTPAEYRRVVCNGLLSE